MFATSFSPRAARSWPYAVLVFLVAGSGTRLLGQPNRVEIHPFASTTLSDQSFLNGAKDGTPVTIAGELRFPRGGAGRGPAVVLLHGSGGISAYVSDWEQELNAQGIATFVIDSFTARGIVSTNNDQAQLGRLTMILDAYRALDLLARHPRIDPERIALMGFSRGGQAALYASVKRFQRLQGRAGAAFAAYVALYPQCGTTFREDDVVAEKPIRIFQGTADDYVPIGPTRAYVSRLKARGANVALTEYEGAGHVFDGRAFKVPVKLEKAQTLRRCELAEADDGVLLNVATHRPFTYADACVEYGPTVAYDEKADADVRKAVREFFASTLKP